MCNLTTRFGRLDVSYRSSGTRGYEDLKRDAVGFELDDLQVQAASLADVIRSKEAAGRERDRPSDDAATERVDCWRDVKPVLESCCVVCHGCYDAPCQLALTAFAGIDRD